MFHIYVKSLNYSLISFILFSFILIPMLYHPNLFAHCYKISLLLLITLLSIFLEYNIRLFTFGIIFTCFQSISLYSLYFFAILFLSLPHFLTHLTLVPFLELSFSLLQYRSKPLSSDWLILFLFNPRCLSLINVQLSQLNSVFTRTIPEFTTLLSFV